MSHCGHAQAVEWRRLELHGFGAHGKLEVAFGSGLATLVAPNEFGKSTLVAGLAATLFGLPHLSDATKFGRERFRAWSNPSRFEGTVSFVARDGCRYELHRNFESHEVRLVRHGAAGLDEIFEGEHNPNARKGTNVYEAQLERLIGMTDREAFRQSFHVAQPLPAPGALGDEVQRLLSGSGSGTFDAALARLEEMLKERTSATGDLGVSSRNLRNDRRLQELERRIEDLERSLREGRQAADEARVVGEELDRLQGERQDALARERRLEASAQALRDWLAAKDAHGRIAADHRKLIDALREARELERRIEEASAEISATWPELVDAPHDLEADLLAAHEAERALAGAEAGLATAAGALEEARAKEASASAELAAHLAAAPAAPGGFAADELRTLRDQAVRALDEWESFCEQEDVVARQRSDLARFGTIDGAAADTLELLRNYPWELERREQAVATERRAREEAAAAERAARDAFGRRATVALVGAVAAAVVVGVVAWRLDAGTLFALLLAVAAGTIGWAALRPRRAAPPQPAAAVASGPPHPTGTPGPGHAGEGLTAEGALDAFMEATRPFVESLDGYRDPSHAVRDWEDAKRRLAEEARLHAQHARSVWNAAPEDVRNLDPASATGAWGGLARYAQVQGGAPATMSDLCAWLGELDREAWEEAIAAADAAAADRARWEETEDRLDREVVRAKADLRGAERVHGEALARLERVRAEESSARSEVAGLLERTGLSAEALANRWRSYRDAVRARDELATRLDGLLGGRGVSTVEELASAEYEARMEAMRTANRVDTLRDEHPELPPLDADRLEAAARLRAVDEDRSAAAAGREAKEREIFQRSQERAGLAALDLVNIAQVELELRELRDERDRLEDEIQALAVAHSELQGAVGDFQASYRERLEAAAGVYLQRFCDAPQRRVALGEGFSVSVVEPDGTRVYPGQLSQGTQDQLLLALRLAIADHLSDDAPLPLILDDPFVNWDASRLRRVEDTLRDLAAERQVILLSHREDFDGWGDPAELA